MWFRRGRTHATVRGEQHGSAKVTEAQVREIRRRYAQGGISYRRLGAEYGVNDATTYRIVTRKLWRHVED